MSRIFTVMNALKKFRQDAKLTQADLAASLAVMQATVSKIENGETPSLSLATKIERLTNGAVPASSWIPLQETNEAAQ